MAAGTLSLFWGFELYHHDDLTFDPKRPRGAFNSYTAFRKRVEEGSAVRASHLEKLGLDLGRNCLPRTPCGSLRSSGSNPKNVRTSIEIEPC